MALLSVDDALARVLADVIPLPAEAVSIADSSGRVLVHDLVARRDQPAADVSSMDGYAVRAADLANLPARLAVIGEAAAGDSSDADVDPGQAVRILTGGVLPNGADTIVIQENTTREGSAVIVREGAKLGRFIRRKGMDFKRDETLLSKGHLLSIRDMALAASMSHDSVRVHRRPKVAIFSTGNELQFPGAVMEPWQIVSSNGLMLAAMARTEGAHVRDLGIAPDRTNEIRERMRDAQDWGADILVTAGGASVGDYDLVQTALVGEGIQLGFWKVALRPGKPLMFGSLGPMRVLGLPGNPVSAFVCAFLFVMPLIRKLAGIREISTVAEQAILGSALPENDERQDYLRGKLETAGGQAVATPFENQDSSRIAALAHASCLIVRRPHAPAANRGDPCAIHRLPI